MKTNEMCVNVRCFVAFVHFVVVVGSLLLLLDRAVARDARYRASKDRLLAISRCRSGSVGKRGRLSFFSQNRTHWTSDFTATSEERVATTNCRDKRGQVHMNKIFNNKN